MLCRYLMEALKTQRIAVPELWTGAALYIHCAARSKYYVAGAEARR